MNEEIKEIEALSEAFRNPSKRKPRKKGGVDG